MPGARPDAMDGQMRSDSAPKRARRLNFGNPVLQQEEQAHG
jgi:hypothetical protein